ncbi:MAG: AmmeMemoRadiSam system protein A [bacterium]|nr:AmmeMemoRadiSam system protein A [bacterium]
MNRDGWWRDGQRRTGQRVDGRRARVPARGGLAGGGRRRARRTRTGRGRPRARARPRRQSAPDRAARGAFVTLHAQGHLRGCIGIIEGRLPLLRAVADNAAAAAVGDPRFPPVTPDEVSNLTLEVSALTPLRTVDGPAGIIIGRHGILLGRQGRQAVFLPQVATEQGWDLPTTLSQLCRKAGLPPDAWREGATLRVFEADVF